MPEKEPLIWQLLDGSVEYVIAGTIFMGGMFIRAWHKLNGTASKLELAAAQETSRKELVEAQKQIYKKMDHSTEKLHQKLEHFQSEAAEERRSDRRFLTDLFITNTSTTNQRRGD